MPKYSNSEFQRYTSDCVLSDINNHTKSNSLFAVSLFLIFIFVSAVLLAGYIRNQDISKQAVLEISKLHELESMSLRSINITRSLVSETRQVEGQMLLNERKKILSESAKALALLKDSSLRDSNPYLERLEKEIMSNKGMQERILRGKVSNLEQKEHTFSQTTSLHDIFEILRNNRSALLIRTKTTNLLLAAAAALWVLVALFVGNKFSRRTLKQISTDIAAVENSLLNLNYNCTSLTSVSKSLKENISEISLGIELATKHLTDSTGYHEDTNKILLQSAHNILEASKSVAAIKQIVNPNDDTNTNPFHIKHAADISQNASAIEISHAISSQLALLDQSISVLSELANKQAQIATQAVSTKDNNESIVSELLQKKLQITEKSEQICQKTEHFANSLNKTFTTLTGKHPNE